jgi:hypothetical protein
MCQQPPRPEYFCSYSGYSFVFLGVLGGLGGKSFLVFEASTAKFRFLITPAQLGI